MAWGKTLTDALHPAARQNLPIFITGPGSSDVLLIVMGVFLVVFVLTVGILMLRLHHLPHHMAEKDQKIQFQIAAVLVILAMFTHENLFWIAGLLLATTATSNRRLALLWQTTNQPRFAACTLVGDEREELIQDGLSDRWQARLWRRI